jgi:hypothetical protein
MATVLYPLSSFGASPGFAKLEEEIRDNTQIVTKLARGDKGGGRSCHWTKFGQNAEIGIDFVDVLTANEKASLDEMLIGHSAGDLKGRKYVDFLPKNRKHRRSGHITIFEPGHGFSMTGVGTFSDEAQGDYMDTACSIRSNSTSVEVAMRNNSLATPVDLQNNYLLIRYKINIVSSISTFSIYVGTNNLAEHYRMDALTTTQAQKFAKNGEWETLLIAFNAGDHITETPPDLSAVDALKIRIIDDGSAPVTLTVQELSLVAKPDVAKYSICFDDNDLTVYTEAFPIMRELGLVGTVFVIVETIGQAGKMTQSHIDVLCAHGWNISAHSYSSAVHSSDFTGATKSDLMKDLRLSREYLDGCNDTDGQSIVAYPHGNFTGTLESVGKFFSAGRTILDYGHAESIPPSSPMKLRPVYIKNSTTLANAETRATNAIDAKLWPIFTFHKLVETPSVSTEWAIADFRSLFETIRDHSTTSVCETISDVLYG